MTWIWIRHAPTHGMAGRLCGWTDAPLDSAGEQGLGRLAAWLPPDARFLTSSLDRCRATAAAWRRLNSALPDAEPVDAFREQFFGAWEGAAYADLPELARWSVEDYAMGTPPGGESFAGLCGRVAAEIERRNDAAGPESTFVVCAHAGVIRAAIAHALRLAPVAALAFAVDPLSITRLTAMTDGAWRIDTVNRHAP